MRYAITRFANNHDIFAAALLLVSFSSATAAGFFLFTAPAVISPAAGIGLAGLILFGIRFWPIIFIGSYVTYLALGAPFLFVLCVSLGHTIQAAGAAYALERFEFQHYFSRLRDILVFTMTAFAAAAIVPSFGFMGLYLIGAHNQQELLSWNHWWTGMTLSILVVTPLVVRWGRKPHRRTIPEIAETLLSFAALLLIAIPLFFGYLRSFGGISLIYFLLLPLGWIALRAGPRMMTLALFLLTSIGIVSVLLRSDTADLGRGLFQTEVFFIIISLIFLLLVAIEEERKDADKRLRRNVGDLEHALDRLNDQNEAKNNFIAMLAHELRNPLATIVSNVELLRLGSHVTEEGAESLTVIEKRLDNMGRLLDDLLDVSRISENKITLKKRRFDLKEAIHGAIENIEHIIKGKDQTLTVDLPLDALTVRGDPTRLEQVFSNLLHNASKFTKRNGTIGISATHKDRSVSVTVRDNGVGIDEEHLTHIFQVFYQGQGTTAEARSGLGIGLALTKDFVQMHGGTILAKSEGKNTGSEFIVTLPLVRGSIPEVAIDTALPKPDPDTGLTWEKHILVVDDNHAAAEGIAKLLRLSGFAVTCAFTGSEAFEQFTSSFKPDVVFLDISLPDMNGFDVARKLRNEYQFDGSIIAISGYGREEDKQRSYESGCSHHLTKPVRLAELLEALK